jgi:hypothetical protein
LEISVAQSLVSKMLGIQTSLIVELEMVVLGVDQVPLVVDLGKGLSAWKGWWYARSGWWRRVKFC